MSKRVVQNNAPSSDTVDVTMEESANYKKRKTVAGDLPTKEEQRQLQQVDLLMKTNILQLKVDSLLDEVSVGRLLQKKKVQAWIDAMVKLLTLNTTDDDGHSRLHEVLGDTIDSTWMNKHCITGLSLVNGNDASMNIVFVPPTSVEVIGSSVHDTVTSSHINIDVALTLPDQLFDIRDILNHRYFDKRMLYLAGLCHGLANEDKSNKIFDSIAFAAFKGDSRKPIVIVTAPFKLQGDPVMMRLIPVIQETAFKLVQLRAAKNNVRPPHWQEVPKGSTVLPPTPLYNLAILEDMAVMLHHRLLVKALGSSAVLQQTVLLLKVWLTQRGMRFCGDGFDGHHAALLVAYLLQTKRITSAGHSSAISVFQTVLTFIGEGHLSRYTMDFTRPDVRERKAKEDSCLQSSLDKMQLSSALSDDTWDFLRPLTLNHPIPSDGSYNCFWRIGESAIDMLEVEARRALKELQSNQDTSCYDYLFMRKTSFFGSHDCFIHIPFDQRCLTHLKDPSLDVLKQDVESCPPLQAVKDASADQRTTWSRMVAHCLPQQHLPARAVQLAVSALGDRVQAVHATVRWMGMTSGDQSSAHHPVWATDDQADRSFDFVVSLGILLNNEKCDRRVDKGPSTAEGSLLTDLAADPDAATDNNGPKTTSHNFDDELTRFRDFWGPKVELRRFKDGSIIEAVVWDQPILARGTADADGGAGMSNNGVPCVVEQVVRYVFGRHLTAVCGLDGRCLYPVFTQLEQFLQLTTSSGSSDRTTRRAVEALDSLRGVLTSKVTSLPLAIEGVSCVSPALRYTSMHPVRPHPVVLSDKGSTVNAASNMTSSISHQSLKEMVKQYAGTTMSLLCPPLRVLVQVESTGKWPINDPHAVKALKVALLLRLRLELSKQYQIASVIHADSLDVCFEGFIFRLVIVASDEVEAALMIEGTHLLSDRTMAVARSLKTPPQHHSSIRSLKAQHPSYSGTVRLFCLWAARHFYTGHLCTELIELIVAHEFLRPSSFAPPGSILTGLYRSLMLLAEHDWEAEPLVVDMTGELTASPSMMLNIITSFRAARSHKHKVSEGPQSDCASPAWDPAFLHAMDAPMYVVSSADKAHQYWPSLALRSPEKVVLAMIVKSAKRSAMRLLEWMKQPLQHGDDEASMEELVDIMSRRDLLMKCDVELRFHRSLVSRDPAAAPPPLARRKVYANTPVTEVGLHSLIAIESDSLVCPVQEEVVGKLRAALHREALFFWDGTKGDKLGVLWRPAVRSSSTFAILNSCNRVVQPARDASHHSVTTMNEQELLLQLIEISNGLLTVHRISDDVIS